jgi:predicted short-subunit dehydrogenase-like oxidoreductase (DUF2520 family)
VKESPTPEVYVLGAGAVGTALAMKLSRAGVPVAGLWARRPDQAASAGALAGVLGTSGDFPKILTESDIVIVAVRADAISEVTRELVQGKHLRREQVLLHCSGASAAADALAPARGKVRGLGTLHPLISFADPHMAAGALRGATMTIEGDAAGLAAARALGQALGGVVVEIEGAAMPIYHAAAVMACNYVVGLADAGVELLVKAGFPRDQALPALIPLVAGTVRNLSELGLPRALTGPIARGDVVVVERHLAALGKQAPALVALYREAGLRTVAVARRMDDADTKTLAKIEAMLSGTKSAEPASKTPPPRARAPRRRG